MGGFEHRFTRVGVVLFAHLFGLLFSGCVCFYNLNSYFNPKALNPLTLQELRRVPELFWPRTRSPAKPGEAEKAPDKQASLALRVLGLRASGF